MCLLIYPLSAGVFYSFDVCIQYIYCQKDRNGRDSSTKIESSKCYQCAFDIITQQHAICHVCVACVSESVRHERSHTVKWQTVGISYFKVAQFHCEIFIFAMLNFLRQRFICKPFIDF